MSNMSSVAALKSPKFSSLPGKMVNVGRHLEGKMYVDIGYDKCRHTLGRKNVGIH